MRARSIAVISIFAALTIALNLSPLKIPAPYAPFLVYQVWEIPIVIAFFIYGSRTAIALAFLNMLILFVVFPGALPTGPAYNFMAVVSMISGLYLIGRVVSFKKTGRKGLLAMIGFTASGLLLRTIVMMIVNFTFLPFPPPVGFGFPSAAVMLYMPFIGFFNASLALYTIPIGYMLARIVAPAAIKV
jgi:riboflavin transporter FmnP